MMKISIRAMGALALAVVACSAAIAQEWTRFRGPNGSGESDAAAIPAQFSEKDYNWKTELPGIGHSSPVIWKNKIFLLSANPDDATRYVLSIDANSGKILWQRDYVSKPHQLHLRSSYASCTPAVDAERVYIAWSTPEETLLKAFDHSGKELWSKNLGLWVSQHGFGTSPMLYEDLVIVNDSQDGPEVAGKDNKAPGESFLAAFDQKTGDLRWKTPRVSNVVSYSVPFVYRGADGKDQLIGTTTAEGVFSLNPRTGEENWRIEDAFALRTVSSPVLVDGMIFGSTGQGGFATNCVVAVQPEPKPQIAYEIRRQAPYVPCIVGRGDLAFLWFDAGIVSCIEASTGEVYWRERVGGDFSSSPIRVGDKIIGVDENGVVVVLAADKEFQILGRNPLGEPSRATPAVADGRVYFRTYSHLISLGGKPAAE